MGNLQKHEYTAGMRCPLAKLDSGSYQLVIKLADKRRIKVGRLGSFVFPAGYYVYTGSAKRGLEARIARHLRRDKKLRWHIDYLLQFATVVEVNRYPNEVECELNKILSRQGGKVIVERFGSSDCMCETHLLYIGGSQANILHQ
jgi:Uri superfamily endonuclease